MGKNKHKAEGGPKGSASRAALTGAPRAAASTAAAASDVDTAARKKPAAQAAKETKTDGRRSVGDLSFDELMASMTDDHAATNSSTHAGGRRSAGHAAAAPSAKPAKMTDKVHAAATERPASDKRRRSEAGQEAEEDAPAVASKRKARRGSKADTRASADAEGDETEDVLPSAPNFARHKAELRALATQDPEFYDFLMKNDRALLDFGKDEGDEEEDGKGGEDDGFLREEEAGSEAGDSEGDVGEVSDDEGGGEEDDAREAAMAARGEKRKRARPSSDAHEAGPPELSMSLLRSILHSAVMDKSWKGLQKLMHAYRAACFMGESSDILTQLGLLNPEKDAKAKKGKGKGKKGGAGDRSTAKPKAEDEALPAPKSLKFRIVTSAVFMKVITSVLRDAEPLLQHHLGPRKRAKAADADKTADAAPAGLLADHVGWEKMSNLVKAFLHATLHLLQDAQDPTLQLFLLRAVRPYIVFLQPFHRMVRNWLKALQTIFAGTEDQEVRVAAFLRIRHMAMTLPQPTLDNALKGMYLAYVRRAKFMSDSSAPHISFMANCVAELYGVAEFASYQHAFIYIRQLALHLRAALTTHTPASVSNVMSWQFVNCLKLWGLVLSKYGVDASRPLFQLVYPVVQLMLGTLRVMPAPKYFPLRLHIASALTELMWSCGVYIPVAPILLEILHAPAILGKPKGAASSVPPSLPLMVKASDAVVDTRAFQEAVVSRAMDVLLDAMKSQFCSVAFPELCVPVVASLRAFAKVSHVSAWRHRAKSLVDAFIAQAQKVAQKRDALHAAPTDRAAIASFMSSEAKFLREERARQLSAAAAAAAAAQAQAQTHAKSESEPGKSRRRVSFRAQLEDMQDAPAAPGEDEDDAAIAGVKRGRTHSARPEARRKAARSHAVDAVPGEDIVEDLNPDDL